MFKVRKKITSFRSFEGLIFLIMIYLYKINEKLIPVKYQISFNKLKKLYLI